MARRATRQKVRPAPPLEPEEATAPKLAEDDFLASLKTEFARAQKSQEGKGGEDLSHRVEFNKRLLQDLWEIHNQFEEVSVHLTIEPSQTLFATFVEFPMKWTFKDGFDFSSVKTIELKDRSQGWQSFTLRFWYYRTPEGAPHLRGIFEWCDGESYHRYTGWMRMMSQAVLYDSNEHEVSVRELHHVLRDVVVAWYSNHLDRSPEKFIAHLKEKYPKGATYAKESYRA